MEDTKTSLREYYIAELGRVNSYIATYKTNYKLDDSDLDLSGVPYEAYGKRRIALLGIQNKSEREKQTALLEVQVLGGHLKSLGKVLEALK